MTTGEVLAVSGQDDHPYLIVSGGAIQRVVKCVGHGAVLGVSVPLPTHGDRGDGAVCAVDDDLFRSHISSDKFACDQGCPVTSDGIKPYDADVPWRAWQALWHLPA